jgi:hypothetical protein
MTPPIRRLPPTKLRRINKSLKLEDYLIYKKSRFLITKEAAFLFIYNP